MLVVAGESLVDLVPLPPGPAGEPRFSAHPGGSPYNCALALGRLGAPTGFLGPISEDGFGEALLAPLRAAGVVPLIRERSARPTALAVVGEEDGRPRYRFYREGSAERDLSPRRLEAALPESPALLQMGGFTPVEAGDAAIWLGLAREAARRGAVISIDPNPRPALIAAAPGYRDRLGRFLDLAEIVKVSDEDLAVLDPAMGLDAHVETLLARPRCRLVVVTLGAGGARADTRQAHARVPAHDPPAFADTVGAGDSLMAGILAALWEAGALAPGRLKTLDGAALEQMLGFGAVVAGLACAHRGCRPPWRAEVEAARAR